MKKSELKDIIAECVAEVVQEQNLPEGWGQDMLKGLKKTFTSDGPDSGAAHYDRNAKMHNRRADYSKASIGDKSKMRAGARKTVEASKQEFETKLKEMLRSAFVEAESVGMKREDVTKAFRSAITSIFNKYKRLEEIAEEQQ